MVQHGTQQANTRPGDPPLVSVVLATYNGQRFIRGTLESVLRQDHPALEVIVCDDGSTDSTPLLVSSFAPRVRLITQANQGVSVARNHGAAAARGEFIAFLDQDDLWEPNLLSTLVPRLCAEPSLALAYADSFIIDDGGTRHGTRAGYLRYRQGRVFSDLLQGNFIPIETMVLRTSAFRECGGFDPGLRYCEDYDLCLRIARRHPIAFEPTPLASYRIHADNLTHQREALVTEWLAILEGVARGPDLAAADREVLRQQLSRRRLDRAWHALRRGDLREADRWLRSTSGAGAPRLAARVRVARAVLGCLPAPLRRGFLSLMPRRPIYGVRVRR